MKLLLIVLLLIMTHVVAFFLGDYFGFRDTVGRDITHGHFLGNPKTEWLEERNMRLLEDFVYIDPRQNAWLAPHGSDIDGASIPQIFWSWIGSPFDGKYRNASIVHDVACKQRDKPHQDVHRMFFDACLAGGVPEHEAKRLYYAVARFGPKWELKPVFAIAMESDPDGEYRPTKIMRTVAETVPSEVATQEKLSDIAAYFSERDPTIEEVEESISQGLLRE